ncbi:Crp/Fnr family transcriptional regulator [Stutzerimonas kunmingensis]|jgi:CRP-like cAMP-binding protein|uniref:DnrE protein n=3 Tax=Stutzerimonas TaxID=2901164 RepID=I4CX90_STUST|nr:MULTISPECIES: Crp/Fnr family transcriptional regulator [Stutzerimonas]MAK88277.1 Crp/Fnr family transcriptional regulator [Pseudomonas sp.]MBU0564164.1 Crp/Fnr family transcriptional regulator [Gammaproteobacteria bacterium]AFM34697.1 DnrE protein [Stutzerimonas stutzeri CCUG 29243]MBU1806329.1 Crp/Fnr family transcriptional regulator [Gammaproteobacteria bacterium]MBU2334191.1 Crp/Fnr family transcriptional regulator [Gammaproteobacteria bacterium]
MAMLTGSAVLNTMRRHHLFNGLAETALQNLAAHTTVKRLPAGCTLFHQGDAAEHFHVLINGQVKLHRVTCDGQEKVIEVVRPGEAFAEALLFNKQPEHPLSATTLKESLVLNVQNAHYLRLLETQPQLCMQLLSSLSDRLNQRLHQIDSLTSSNVCQRVVRYLFQELQAARSGVIDLDLPKRLIASQLGIQPETLSRILHRLTDAGLIAVQRRRIEILDQRSLSAYLEAAA